MSLHQASGLTRTNSPRTRTARTQGPLSRPGCVLGIVSGKGGVGKSTLAVNLVTSAAESGGKVLLVDGDLGLANADLLMGLVPAYDLEDWCGGRADLAEAVCRSKAGVGVVVSGSGREVARRMSEAIAGATESELGRLIDAQDLTVMDLGAGIGNHVLKLASSCDLVWLVATPEPTSLADAYATAKNLWHRTPSLRIELVINRAPDQSVGVQTHQTLGRIVQRFLSRTLPLRGILPEDPAMGRAVARQSPLVVEEPWSPASRRIRMLAESLLEECSIDSACETLSEAKADTFAN